MRGILYFLIFCLAANPLSAQNNRDRVTPKKIALATVAAMGLVGIIGYFITKNALQPPSPLATSGTPIIAPAQQSAAVALHNPAAPVQPQNPPSAVLPSTVSAGNNAPIMASPTMTSHPPTDEAPRINLQQAAEIVASADRAPIIRLVTSSLSLLDTPHAALAVSTNTDLEIINTLLTRADLRKDPYLQERLSDLKDLINNIQELLQELRAKNTSEEEIHTTKFFEILDILQEQTDDPELSEFIFEQLQVLATIHMRIRQHIKKHYRITSKGKTILRQHQRVNTDFFIPPAQAIASGQQ